MLKDMTALNKKRFIIYGVIFGIFFAITAGGISLNLTGYGNIGKMRKVLQPYVTKYNSLSEVRKINNTKNNSMKASINDNGILVTYKKEKYTYKVMFNYKTESDMTRYLETSYNKLETPAETVVKLMIDAVSVTKGNVEGKVFDAREYSDFFSTSDFSKGLELRSSSSKIVAKINLEVNLLESIGGSHYSTTDTSFEITYDNTDSFDNYATYTLPTGFSDDGSEHSISTETNTCIAKFNIISELSATSSNEFASLLADSKNASVDQQEINGKTWNKIVYNSSQGGIATYYSIDTNGKVLGFEYQSFYDNDECDGYLNTIVDSLNLK